MHWVLKTFQMISDVSCLSYLAQLTGVTAALTENVTRAHCKWGFIFDGTSLTRLLEKPRDAARRRACGKRVGQIGCGQTRAGAQVEYMHYIPEKRVYVSG